MAIFTRRTALSAVLFIAVAAMMSACGNKGDLYLVTPERVIQHIGTVEDALDELEVMEAEEENPS